MSKDSRTADGGRLMGVFVVGELISI